MPSVRAVAADRPMWASVAAMVVSLAAAVYGIPVGDVEIQALLELVSQGVVAVSGVLAAVRAIVVARRGS